MDEDGRPYHRRVKVYQSNTVKACILQKHLPTCQLELTNEAAQWMNELLLSNVLEWAKSVVHKGSAPLNLHYIVHSIVVNYKLQSDAKFIRYQVNT